jgi:hypothetical protein
MPLWVEVMRASAAVNVLMLVGLTAIWARNYRQMRSKHALGLAVFGLLLLSENGMAFYFYAMHPQLHGWYAGLADPARTATLLLQLLQTTAIAFLAWISWD